MGSSPEESQWHLAEWLHSRGLRWHLQGVSVPRAKLLHSRAQLASRGLGVLKDKARG